MHSRLKRVNIIHALPEPHRRKAARGRQHRVRVPLLAVYPPDRVVPKEAREQPVRDRLLREDLHDVLDAARRRAHRAVVRQRVERGLAGGRGGEDDVWDAAAGREAEVCGLRARRGGGEECDVQVDVGLRRETCVELVERGVGDGDASAVEGRGKDDGGVVRGVGGGLVGRGEAGGGADVPPAGGCGGYGGYLG